MSNYRSPALLAQARGSNCLLRIEGVCNNDTNTTVAAHSNWLEHGKGRGLKASDYMTVQACYACHTWLDQGKSSKADKRAAFDKAHARQVAVWSLKANQVPAHPHAKLAKAALDAYHAAKTLCFTHKRRKSAIVSTWTHNAATAPRVQGFRK